MAGVQDIIDNMQALCQQLTRLPKRLVRKVRSALVPKIMEEFNCQFPVSPYAMVVLQNAARVHLDSHLLPLLPTKPAAGFEDLCTELLKAYLMPILRDALTAMEVSGKGAGQYHGGRGSVIRGLANDNVRVSGWEGSNIITPFVCTPSLPWRLLTRPR